MRQEELYDSIKMCEHDSDYSVLYDFVGMRHVMCDSCWHGEEHVRTGKDTISVFRKWQLRAVNVMCLRCDTNVTAQMGCTGCFPVLPTAKNISKYIAACKTLEEFKSVVTCISDSSYTHVEKCETVEEFESVVPGSDGGDVFVDGTHCHVQRPSEKTVRRMRFSGKKKQFTNNTNVYTNANGVIIGISKSFVGSTGDITLLREDPMPFGKWAESMRDEATLKEDRIRIWADRGYQGTGKDLPGATLMIPYKRSKKHRILTVEQKAHNHLVNSTRVLVEHSIGRIKRYARLTDPYDGTIGEFNREFNVITGLVNLHLLWDKIDKSPPSPDRWVTLIDWNGIVPLAKGAPF